MANNNKHPLIASAVAAVVLCLLLGVSGAENGAAAAGGGGGGSVLDAAASIGGSGGPMSCMGKLEKCQKFLSDPSAEPSPECCTPMKEVVTKEVACLCTLFQNAALLRSVNMTQDNALSIAKKCGADADPSICKNVAPSPLASQLNAAGASQSSTPSGTSSSESEASNGRKLTSPYGVFLVVLSFLGLIM